MKRNDKRRKALFARRLAAESQTNNSSFVIREARHIFGAKDAHIKGYAKLNIMASVFASSLLMVALLFFAYLILSSFYGSLAFLPSLALLGCFVYIFGKSLIYYARLLFWYW